MEAYVVKSFFYTIVDWKVLRTSKDQLIIVNLKRIVAFYGWIATAQEVARYELTAAIAYQQLQLLACR